ncbi:MAG: Maf family protein [Gammaproteobacteria bacterium]
MNQELIVLASASPRRRELLRQINVEHEVRPADVDETRLPGETPDRFTGRVALSKAERVLEGADGRIVLAADTAVVLRDEIFGKPADAIDAAAMLRRLSGRAHQVVTAVAGACGEARRLAVSSSRVTFRELDDAEIERYVASGEPMGKAGAYAVQGYAALFIERLEGSFSGVMGLPLFETGRMIAELGGFLRPAIRSPHSE